MRDLTRRPNSSNRMKPIGWMRKTSVQTVSLMSIGSIGQEALLYDCFWVAIACFGFRV
jgi:hypothetical protein